VLFQIDYFSKNEWKGYIWVRVKRKSLPQSNTKSTSLNRIIHSDVWIRQVYQIVTSNKVISRVSYPQGLSFLMTPCHYVIFSVIPWDFWVHSKLRQHEKQENTEEYKEGEIVSRFLKIVSPLEEKILRKLLPRNRVTMAKSWHDWEDLIWKILWT